jgi:CubicO group peptidase (beta-lactamase class C family)
MRILLLVLMLNPLMGQTIKKLDGTTITTQQAEAFAHQTFEKHKVTGAQIAVLNNGQLVWSMSHGLRQQNPDLPMTNDTVTWAASITKGLFGAYVAQLVERKEFFLDTPIAKLLPKPLDAYEPFKETATELVKDPRWQRVTPRILLSHTSSLHNFAFLEPDKKMHLRAEPGTAYRYSGEGLNIVQFVIEQQKGRLLDQLMQDAIFTPLQMTRTGIIFRKDFESNIADRFNAEGKFISKTRRFPARASGSMSTTAEDLARFATHILNIKTGDLFKPQFKIRTLHQFPVAENEPEGLEAKQLGIAYGLGWGLLTKTKFGPAFFKEGHGDGAQNFMICFTRSKSCMILLTNSDNGERAYKSLFETILGNTVSPWKWHGYPTAN